MPDGMEPTTTDANDVQPNEGQGDLHEHLLSTVPEGLRDSVQPLLAEWDKGVQKKFTEAAEYRKQWEPYEELGINQLPPEDLSELLAFRELAQDPEAFRQWYDQIGEVLNEGQEESAELDDEGEPEGNPEFEAMRAEFEELKAWRDQQEQDRVVNQMAEKIRSDLDEIRAEHPNVPEEHEEAICALALQFDGEDAVRKGFEVYQQLMSSAENNLFKSKTEAPGPAMSGGTPNTASEPITDFKNASQAAMQRMMHS